MLARAASDDDADSNQNETFDKDKPEEDKYLAVAS